MESIPKKNRNFKTNFALRIDPELLAWVREQAQKQDRPINYIINHAIKQFRKQQ